MEIIVVFIIILIIIFFIISTSNMTTEHMEQPENVEFLREMTRYGPNADTTSNEVIGIINTSEMNKELANQPKNVEFAKELTQHDSNEDTTANEAIGTLNTSEMTTELPNQPENVEFAWELTQHNPNEDTTANEAIEIINTSEMTTGLTNQQKNVEFVMGLTQRDLKEDTSQIKANVNICDQKQTKTVDLTHNWNDREEYVLKNAVVRRKSCKLVLRLPNEKEIENFHLLVPKDKPLKNEGFDLSVPSALEDGKIYMSKNFIFNLTVSAKKNDTLVYTKNFQVLVDDITGDESYQEFELIAGRVNEGMHSTKLHKRDSDRTDSKDSHSSCDAFGPCPIKSITQNDDGVLINGTIFLTKTKWNTLVIEFGVGGQCAYRCVVCSVAVDAHTTDDHMLMEEHGRRLSECPPLPAYGENVIRHIYDVYFHCAICNIVILNADEHIIDTYHKSQLKWSLESAQKLYTNVLKMPQTPISENKENLGSVSEKGNNGNATTGMTGNSSNAACYASNGPAATPNNVAHSHSSNANLNMTTDSSLVLYTNWNNGLPYTNWNNGRPATSNNLAHYSYGNMHTNVAANSSNNSDYINRVLAYYDYQRYGIENSSNIPHYGNRGNAMPANPTNVAQCSSNIPHYENTNNAMTVNPTNVAQCSSNVNLYGNRGNEITANPTNVAQCSSNIPHYDSRGNEMAANPTNVNHYGSNIPHYGSRGNEMAAYPTNVAHWGSNIPHSANRGNEMPANPTNVSHCSSNIPHYGSSGNEMAANPTNVPHCGSNIPHSGNRGNEMSANPTNVAQCSSNIPHYDNTNNALTVNPTNVAQCSSNIHHYGNRGNEITANPTNVAQCSSNIPHYGSRGNEMAANPTNGAHCGSNIPHSGYRSNEMPANPTNVSDCSSNIPHYGSRGNEMAANPTNVAHGGSNIPHSGNRGNEMPANPTNVSHCSSNIPHYANSDNEMTANPSNVAQCSNFTSNMTANSNSNQYSQLGNRNQEIATTSGNIAYNPNVTTRMTTSSSNIPHSNNTSNAANTSIEYRNIALTANPKYITIDDIRRKAMSPDSGENLDADKAWKALMEKRMWRNPGHAAKSCKDNNVVAPVAGSTVSTVSNSVNNKRADFSQAVLKLKKIVVEPNKTVTDPHQSLSDNEEIPTVSILDWHQKCSSTTSLASGISGRIVSDNKDTVIVKNETKGAGYLKFSSNLKHTGASNSKTFTTAETIQPATDFDQSLSDNETASTASVKSDTAASAGWWDVSSEFPAGNLNKDVGSDRSSDSEDTMYTASANTGMNREYPLLSKSPAAKQRQTVKTASGYPALKPSRTSQKSKPDQVAVGFSYAQMAAKKDLVQQTPKHDPQNVVINIGGGKYVLASDNFHCLTPCKGNWYCMVCVIAFTLEAKTTHKLSGDHRGKLTQCPYFDDFGKNMIRKMNSAYSHCGVCNIIVQARQAEHHIENKKHQRLTRYLTAYSEEYGPAARQEPPRGSEEGVVLKDIQVPTVNVLLQVHGTYLEISVYSWQGVLMDTWGGWQRCVFCYDVLQPLMVPGHVNSAEHQTRMQQFNFLKEYGASCVRELNEKWIHCGICNRAFTNERAYIARHIEGVYHADKLRAATVNRKNYPHWNPTFKADADKLKADADKVLQSLNKGGNNASDACKQDLNRGGRQRLNTTGSSVESYDTGHRSVYAAGRHSRKTSESLSRSGSVASVASVMGTESKKKMQSRNNSRPQSRADHHKASSEDLSAPFMVTFRNRRIIIGSNSWHGIHVSAADGAPHCYLCQTPVDEELSEHVMGLRHDSEIMATQLLETHVGHFIRELTPERGHCVTCNTVVGRGALGSHVSDAAHARRLEAAVARARSPPDDIEQVNYDEFYDQHDPATKMYLIKHKTESLSVLVEWCWWHGLQVGDRQLRCAPCGVAVADEQRREHASDERHAGNVAACRLIVTHPGHYIRQVREKSLQCITCNSILQVQHLKNHTDKLNHVKCLREAQYNATLPNPNAEIILYSDYCENPQPSTTKVEGATKSKKNKPSKNKAAVTVVPEAKKQQMITEKDELQDIIKEKSVKQVIKKPKKKKQPIEDKPKSKAKLKEAETKDTNESKMQCVSLELLESSPVDAVCRVILPVCVDDTAPKSTRLLQYILGNNPTVKSGLGIHTPGLLIELDHSTGNEKNEEMHGRKSSEVMVTFETVETETSGKDVKRETVDEGLKKVVTHIVERTEGGTQPIADPKETKSNEKESENDIALNVTIAKPKVEPENVKDSVAKVAKLKKSKANIAKSIEKESKNKDIDSATTVPEVDVEQRKEMKMKIHNDDGTPSLFVSWSAWHGLHRDGDETTCLLCDATVPASEEEQHTSVEGHAQQLKISRLLDQYPSLVRMLKMTAHCLTCNDIVDMNKAIDHTADAQHRERLLKAQMPTNDYFIKGIISFPQYVERQSDVLKEISNTQIPKNFVSSEKTSTPSADKVKKTVGGADLNSEKDYVEMFDGKYPCIRVRGNIAYCIPCEMYMTSALAGEHMSTQEHVGRLTNMLVLVRAACSIAIRAPMELGPQLDY